MSTEPRLKIDFIRNQSQKILALETNLQGSDGIGPAIKMLTENEDSEWGEGRGGL